VRKREAVLFWKKASKTRAFAPRPVAARFGIARRAGDAAPDGQSSSSDRKLVINP